MKKKFTLIILLILPTIFYPQDSPSDNESFVPLWQKGDVLTVFSPNGLYLYKSICTDHVSSCHYSILEYLPKGTKVKFKEIVKDEEYQEYFGIKAPIVKVSYKNIEGFIFSGLLSNLPNIPNSCSSLKEYIESNFGSAIKTEKKEWCVSEYGEHCGTTLIHSFKNDVALAFSNSSGTNGADVHDEEIINLTNSLHDSFLIALNCGPALMKFYKYSNFSRDAGGWYMDSDIDDICESGDAAYPLLTIRYGLRYFYDEENRSHLKITRNKRYSDNCK